MGETYFIIGEKKISIWLHFRTMLIHGITDQVFEETRNKICETVFQVFPYDFTWFSVAPLWRWVVRWWGGPLSLHRTRPNLPETSWRMLPDDILKITPENINMQQLIYLTDLCS